MDEKNRGARGVASSLAGLARKNLRVIVACACVLVFLMILEDVYDAESMRLDRAAYWLIVEHLRTPWLTPVMESFSALATPVSLVVLLLAVAAFAPGKRPGMCCAVNLVLVVVINQVLKFIIQRPRPDGFRLATASGFSFPSGHSMAAMAFFGLLAWLVWKNEADRRLRCLYATGFALVIVMIGVSRIYLGVHYASDVLGGFCLSMAWLAVYTRVAVPLFIGEDDLGSSGEEALRR
ncbi:phosphatase PAP2 family protein [uncultured Parolsenella sp.]|uniref:phosphatase PAP2 family protein n=1 Tax=uncultured Parolsenella sp. TaxID=2083008 RepID=UPI00265A60BE|nr:phosphatase PAP2 family protein [uncultured Parolsenella sp.]